MTITASQQARTARDKRLQSQFNISADEWDIILKFQGGVCAICKEKLTKTGKNKGKPKPLNTDHDHKSGLTRGILCTGCNWRLRESMDLEWVTNAYFYLLSPPALFALGEERYGRKGRVTSKSPKRRSNRRKK